MESTKNEQAQPDKNSHEGKFAIKGQCPYCGSKKISYIHYKPMGLHIEYRAQCHNSICDRIFTELYEPGQNYRFISQRLDDGTVIEAEILQPTLTPDEANDLAFEFTKHLSPENIAYIKNRAATEGKHPSELLDNIITTSRTLYRSPVGERHG